MHGSCAIFPCFSSSSDSKSQPRVRCQSNGQFHRLKWQIHWNRVDGVCVGGEIYIYGDIYIKTEQLESVNQSETGLIHAHFLQSFITARF